MSHESCRSNRAFSRKTPLAGARALCWREFLADSREKEPTARDPAMTDHAAPLIAKLTAELAASYVVRLCQRERVTSN